jgi:hypothetical protein
MVNPGLKLKLNMAIHIITIKKEKPKSLVGFILALFK